MYRSQASCDKQRNGNIFKHRPYENVLQQTAKKQKSEKDWFSSYTALTAM
jgi:hypothetical protein